MNPYEREYFVSRLRSGAYYIKLNGIRIKVLTPTIEDEFFANEAFQQTYEEAMIDGIYTESEMSEWMEERGLWTKEQEAKIEGTKDDIEKLKVKIFESRSQEKMREHIRLYLRAAERALSGLFAEKNELFSKTCEGLASQEKTLKLFEKCCFVGDSPLDCDDINMSSLFHIYSEMLMGESELRELARNDPWRFHWMMRDHSPLFINQGGRQLSSDQKGILIWSNMYDNVQESMDCPTEDVINDDDMLDGWFIVQRKKQESERAKVEVEKKTNAKIANSDEILIFTDSKKEADNIHSMNSFHGDIVRKQRIATAKQKGTAVDLDFQDRRLNIAQEQNQRFKETSRRK